jgi:hypothetical protein
MHGSVREGLKNLLAAQPFAAASARVIDVRDSSLEIEPMRGQARLLRTLQAPGGVEPSGGFYARVMQRIEMSARRSIWWVFVYSPVGKRLAYASLAVTIALGSYVIAAESSDGHLHTRSTVAQIDVADHYDAPVMGTEEQQRAAVLENFVQHPSPRDSASLQ